MRAIPMVAFMHAVRYLIIQIWKVITHFWPPALTADVHKVK